MQRPLLVSFALVGLTTLGQLAAQGPTVRYFDPTFTPVVTASDVVYGSNINPWTNTLDTLKLDVYEPQGDTEAARPVYIHIHGGQYFYGTKTNGEAVLMCQTFASLGYVAFSIDYRLAPTYQHNNLGPDTCAEDAKAAVRFVRKNALTYRVDSSRILCGGDSVGGTSGFIVGFTSWPGNSGNPGYNHVPNACISMWSNNFAPLTNTSVSILVLHGTADTVLPFSVAQNITASATWAGVRNRLIPVVGGDHSCWDKWDNFKRDMWGTAYEFLRLWERSGLTINPDFATALRLDFCSTGWEGIVDVVWASPNQGLLPFPPYGILRLDPTLILTLGTAVHAPNNLTDKQILSFPIPPGVKGTLYAQHFGISTTTWWLTGFSNLLTIAFP